MLLLSHSIAGIGSCNLCGMGTSATDFFVDLRRFVESYGVQVRLQPMPIEKPGKFDGLSITLNPRHDVVAAAFYLAHSFGSVAQWSLDFAGSEKVFENLREAKKRRRQAPVVFEAALARYRTFEHTSSEHAVWTLAEAGHPGAIEPYTIFFRAGIEAMTIFHRTGKAPNWPRFYTRWKRGVERGEIRAVPFIPRPVPRF